MSTPGSAPTALPRVTARVPLHLPASQAGMPSVAQSRLRRFTFFSFVFLGTVIGIWLMFLTLSVDGVSWAEWGLLTVFIPLFYQLNVGFWTALTGVWMMNRPKADPLDLSQTINPDDARLPLTATTAIIVPVYNEDVTRVFEGVRAIYKSLQKTGHSKSFDFFVLSDSDDPNKWIEEEAAWLELCRQENAFGHFFYRKRRAPINRKSGNVSDFCRRWGKRYRYMVVLDADSLMSGSLIVNMVRIMEKHPGLGILQTFPKQFGATTLLGRVMQFAQGLYGPAFVAGLNYWQCGESNFWGHNAIVRLAPFIEYCALPPLPGKGPLGGHILSHDFVEAALMRKAGYAVRLLTVNDGSYEEGPPTLTDMLKRDRRWCQGNLQHFKLIFADGLHFISRLNFIHGILSYASSPLWFLFLIFSTIIGATTQAGGLLSPAAHLPGELLLGLTVMLIFLPKILIAMDELFTGRQFKPVRLRLLAVCSSFLDTFVFTLLAPIMMIFHSRFVIYTILGKGVNWIAQRRKLSSGIDWREPILTFASTTVLGLLWATIAFFLPNHFFWWMLPVLGAMVLSIPYAIATSSTRSLFRFGIFLTKEEIDPPPVVQSLEEHLDVIKDRPKLQPDLEQNFGLVQVCLDPYVNGLHVSLLRRRKNQKPSREYFDYLSLKLITQGPGALHAQELKAIMYDPDSVTHLHYALWSASEEQLSSFWKVAIRQYNLVAPNPFTHLIARVMDAQQAD